jgi:DNA-binding GntR family transcriptional regulator
MNENSDISRAGAGPLGVPAAEYAPGLLMPRAPSLAEQVADAIVDGIAMGALQPGQRIIEVELAKQLQVSRVPVRESLKMLEAQGILETIPHRGARVAAFSETRIDQICAARVALERLAIRDAIVTYRANPARIGQLDAIIARMEAAADRLDWVAVSKADLAFHREICAASGNGVVTTLWETLARHVMIVFGREIRDERDAARLGPQHRRLRDMLLDASLDELDAEIERHILRLRGRGAAEASS